MVFKADSMQQDGLMGSSEKWKLIAAMFSVKNEEVSVSFDVDSKTRGRWVNQGDEGEEQFVHICSAVGLGVNVIFATVMLEETEDSRDQQLSAFWCTSRKRPGERPGRPSGRTDYPGMISG